MKVNTICELAKDELRNWTILVNFYHSGMNSAHNYLKSLVSNCIDLSSVNRLI